MGEETASEELLARLEAIPEGLQAAADPDAPEHLAWAAGALAAAFTPHAVASGAAAHPLLAYRGPARPNMLPGSGGRCGNAAVVRRRRRRPISLLRRSPHRTAAALRAAPPQP